MPSTQRTLAALGCEIVQVAAADALPDSVFVEDTAIVLDEIAVITRPGAALAAAGDRRRRGNAGRFRQLQFLSEPATLDGGDVLRLGRVLYVGLGSADEQRRSAATGRFRFACTATTSAWSRVDDALHLLSAAVTFVVS